MKKLMIISVTVILVLTGCNAVKGLGKDVSKTGETISNTATEVQQKI